MDAENSAASSALGVNTVNESKGNGGPGVGENPWEKTVYKNTENQKRTGKISL